MTPVDLKGLEKTAKKLNAETEELNSVIDDLESRLAKMGIGVSAWTGQILGEREWTEEREGQPWASSNPFYAAQSNSYKVYFKSGLELGYAKVGESWVIAVRKTRGEGSDPEDLKWSDEEPTALLSASRNIRVEAAQHLEKVVAAIQRRAEGFIQDISGAKALLK